MAATSIEWCDHSINPIRARLKGTDKVGHYCEKVASGCANCYASRMQPRFSMPQFQSSKFGMPESIEIFLDESKLAEVVARKKPTKYFWCDMTDIFGRWVTTEMHKRCIEAVDASPQHVHLWLTKRLKYAPNYLALAGQWIPRKTMWLGASVSNQRDLNECIYGCGAEWNALGEVVGIRFLSIEPLVSEIDFDQAPAWSRYIDWVIVGGESGPNARPCQIEWIAKIVDQCSSAGIPCFVKQIGSKPIEDTPIGVGDLAITTAKGNDPNEWPRRLRVRQMPGDEL